MITKFYRITMLLAFGCILHLTGRAQCVGGFTDSVDSLTVYFTNQATGSYNYIEYDFGDGNWINYVANPTHTYSSEGIYEVCQFIMDTVNWNCFDYVCDTLNIGNVTCQAGFWWYPDELDVEFWNESLGTYDSLSWDFGDNTTSNDSFPFHTYANPGQYTVCLSLFDSSGVMCDSSCQSVYVDSSSCQAAFSHSASGLEVDFTNLSTGNFNTQYWDFGDNFGSSNAANPSYTYFTSGTYEVCMYVYDTIGGFCYDDTCMLITVSNGGGSCEADFTYATDGLDIECTNTSTGTFLTAIWDFGDGSTPGFTPSHSYMDAGTYEVCLTIANPFPFCADQYCESVTVVDLTCEPTFEYSCDQATNTCSFSNTTTVGNVTSVEWDFGDGNTSTFANPSYAYNQPGTYEVCLSTYDNGQLCGIGCRTVEVYPLGVGAEVHQEWSVYPNPSDGHFTIERSGNSGRVQIELTDLAGRTVYRQWSNDARLEVNSDVPSGTYMLRIARGTETLEIVPVVVK